jgi:hypothetical protein
MSEEIGLYREGLEVLYKGIDGGVSRRVTVEYRIRQEIK